MLKTLKTETGSHPAAPMLLGLIVWATASAGGWYGVVTIFLIGGTATLWFDTLKKSRNSKHVSIPETKSTPEPYISLPDTPETASVRKRSIDAMKRAGVARQSDMIARSEQPAKNIFTEQYLADIEFNYRDKIGHDSHRHVGVEAVDDEYFEGHCYKANDTRTFVIGRVRGDILDRDTGELIRPKIWAAQVREDSRNSGIVTNRGWKPSSPSAHDIHGRTIEILFTGFSKERRAELEDQAEMSGMFVRKSVTKELSYLCAGPNAGPAKLAAANEHGVQIISEGEFMQMSMYSGESDF